MKKLLILVASIIANIAIFAQSNDYYWYKEQKKQVEINYNYLYIASSTQSNYISLFNSLNYEIENFKEGEISQGSNDAPQYWKILKITNTQLNKV